MPCYSSEDAVEPLSCLLHPLPSATLSVSFHFGGDGVIKAPVLAASNTLRPNLCTLSSTLSAATSTHTSSALILHTITTCPRSQNGPARHGGAAGQGCAVTCLPLAFPWRNLHPDRRRSCHDVRGIPGMLRCHSGVSVSAGNGKKQSFGSHLTPCAGWHMAVLPLLGSFPTSGAGRMCEHGGGTRWPLQGARRCCVAWGHLCPARGALAELAGPASNVLPCNVLPVPACRAERMRSAWFLEILSLLYVNPHLAFIPSQSGCPSKHPPLSYLVFPTASLLLCFKAACSSSGSFKESSTIFSCLDQETAKTFHNFLVRTSRYILENPLLKCYRRPWCEAAAQDSWHRMSLIG